MMILWNGSPMDLEKYGVKTQGFSLPMVKNLKENTECHYYASGIGMSDLTKELVDEYYQKGIDPCCILCTGRNGER